MSSVLVEVQYPRWGLASKLEVNLNQFFTLQSEQVNEDERHGQTPGFNQSYLLDDPDITPIIEDLSGYGQTVMDPPITDGPRAPGVLPSGSRHTVHLLRRQSLPMGAMGRGTLGQSRAGRLGLRNNNNPRFTDAIEDDTQSLIGALKSLESTIEQHCKLLKACKPKREKSSQKNSSDMRSMGPGMPPGMASSPTPITPTQSDIVSTSIYYKYS